MNPFCCWLWSVFTGWQFEKKSVGWKVIRYCGKSATWTSRLIWKQYSPRNGQSLSFNDEEFEWCICLVNMPVEIGAFSSKLENEIAKFRRLVMFLITFRKSGNLISNTCHFQHGTPWLLEVNIEQGFLSYKIKSAQL